MRTHHGPLRAWLQVRTHGRISGWLFFPCRTVSGWKFYMFSSSMSYSPILGRNGSIILKLNRLSDFIWSFLSLLPCQFIAVIHPTEYTCGGIFIDVLGTYRWEGDVCKRRWTFDIERSASSKRVEFRDRRLVQYIQTDVECIQSSSKNSVVTSNPAPCSPMSFDTTAWKITAWNICSHL